MIRITIKDIAKEAGYSTATVSRVLNKADDPFISDATRKIVQETAARLGYTANRAAKALATGKTNFIEIQIPPFQSYNVEVSSTLHSILAADAYDAFYLDPAKLKPGMMDQGWPVDGVISMAAPECISNYLAIHKKMPLPFVSIGARYCKDIDHVGLDLYPGSAEVMEHLISLGCKHIVYLVDSVPDYMTQPRGLAYINSMQAAGLKEQYIFTKESTRRGAKEAVSEMISNNNIPDAIFAHNDDKAIGACRALMDSGIKVPQDILIAGCDGIEDTQFSIPSITTIVTPVEEMCKFAWLFLNNRIHNPDIPVQSRILTPRLQINESTRR